MTEKLRISVAEDEPDMREFFKDVLPRLGHEVVSVAENGRQLLDDCRRLEPDLVITDLKMPDMDGFEAAEQIYRERPLPIVVVSAYHDAACIEQAEQTRVFAYLVKPIRMSSLGPAIAVAMRRFREFLDLHKEADGLRQALEDRKVIEKAKGILMRVVRISEEDAYVRLQKLASQSNRKLVDVARMIVMTSGALEPPGES
ncbi:MAG: response regulator [Planctomycetes bacterium]|nr:response regulator [Planctomycetota bacterium]